MKPLPRPGRRTRHSLLRFAPLAALLLILVSGGTALASAPTDAWPYEWRPNWIPGDPPEADRGFLEMPWMALRPSAPGLLIALDPVTRRPIKPSSAQRAAASALLDTGGPLTAPDGAFPVEHLLGGGELVHLQGRFQIFSVARRGADGRFTTSCVELERKEK
jgi:hypothetical protein